MSRAAIQRFEKFLESADLVWAPKFTADLRALVSAARRAEELEEAWKKALGRPFQSTLATPPQRKRKRP